MSNDSPSSPPAASIHENHYREAEDCQKWGGWGYAHTKAEPMRWWCQEHYPHKDHPVKLGER